MLKYCRKANISSKTEYKLTQGCLLVGCICDFIAGLHDGHVVGKDNTSSVVFLFTIHTATPCTFIAAGVYGHGIGG